MQLQAAAVICRSSPGRWVPPGVTATFTSPVTSAFSELVSQLTDGRFTITNYPEGSLCAANQLFDYVQNGTIQCGGDWGGYWSGKDTAFELLSTTMDNFTGMDYYIWITQGGGLKCYQDMYGKYNMTYFPIMINHAESGIRSTKPITSIRTCRA